MSKVVCFLVFFSSTVFGHTIEDVDPIPQVVCVTQKIGTWTWVQCYVVDDPDPIGWTWKGCADEWRPVCAKGPPGPPTRETKAKPAEKPRTHKKARKQARRRGI